MSVVQGIAITGLQTASRRVSVAADNIANVRTGRSLGADGSVPDGVYQPHRVQQVSLDGGGVRAVRQPVDPATVVTADPDNPGGLAAYPNVDLAEQLVELRLSAVAYEASGSVLRVAARLEDALLDITA